MSTSSNPAQFVVSVARHTIETSGIRLKLTESQKRSSGIGALWRPEPTPAILTGVAYGPVNLVVRVDTEEIDSNRYEDIVVLPVDVIGPVAFFGELDTPGIQVPQFSIPPGRYGLRVATNGADLNYDLDVTEPTQTITIEFRSEESPEPRALAITSRTGLAFARSAKLAVRRQNSNGHDPGLGVTTGS